MMQSLRQRYSRPSISSLVLLGAIVVVERSTVVRCVTFLGFSGFMGVNAVRYRSSTRRAIQFGLAALAALLAAIAELLSPRPITTIVLAAVFSGFLASFVMADHAWTRVERRRYVFWLNGLITPAVAGIVILVEEGKDHPAAGAIGSSLPSGWSLACLTAVLIVAALGGLVVFAPSTPWEIAAGWAALGGIYSLSTVIVALTAMGELENHGKLIRRDQVDALFSYFVLVSPVGVTAAFAASYAFRRRLSRPVEA
jgi:hypothetical protein